MTRPLLLALALATAACTNTRPPPPPPPRAPAPPPGATEAPPADPVPPPPPQPDDLPDFPTTEDWQDDTQGVTCTIVYVTEKGSRNNPQPAALVFSSDKDNDHFQRKNSARVTVHRLVRERMTALLGELGQLGFHKLPWSEQPYDAQIGPERALYLYREGKRFRVQKDALGGGDAQTFTALERKLIATTMHDER